MTDLTETQRIDRARRAEMALEEFLDPAFEAVVSAYAERVEELASVAPWEAQKITALSNAIRIARQVRSQIGHIVAEGEVARSKRDRAQEIERLSPAKRRFLNIAPF